MGRGKGEYRHGNSDNTYFIPPLFLGVNTMDIDFIEEEFKNAKYEKFMIESNIIEGEIGLNPGDMEAMRYVIGGGLKTEKRLLKVHEILTKHLDVSWSGKYRDCAVVVGGRPTPSAASITYSMDEFFKQFSTFSAWEAHNIFEIIHPFRDFNGRTGRLIWLSKALKEYNNVFALPFLHRYYYETLNYWSNT